MKKPMNLNVPSITPTQKFSIKQFARCFSYLAVSNMVNLLHEKCTSLELFWSAFSRIWTEYGEILCIPY